ICSVANYLLNLIATRPTARPVYTRQSLKQTMQYKHLLCNRTSYANTCTSCYAAPLMQTPAMLSTCCLCKPPQQIPAKGPLPTRNAHQNDRTQTRNLSKFRLNCSLNFRHKPT